GSEDVTAQDRTGAPGSGSSVDPEPATADTASTAGNDATTGTDATTGSGPLTGDSGPGGSGTGGGGTGGSGTGDSPTVNQPSSADEATQVMPVVDESDADNRRVTRDELYA